MSSASNQHSPVLFFETVNAHQKSSAIKAAIELDLFTAIADGNNDPKSISEKCSASERGIRILCDYLVVLGFLTKNDGDYSLSPDSAVFLNKHSQAYSGGAVEFLLSPIMMESFATTGADWIPISPVVRSGKIV